MAERYRKSSCAAREAEETYIRAFRWYPQGDVLTGVRSVRKEAACQSAPPLLLSTQRRNDPGELLLGFGNQEA